MKKIIITTIIICLLILLMGCYSHKQHVCPATSLIIDKSSFPKGTSQDEINSPVADEPTNSAFRQLYLIDSGASQFVFVYSSEKRTSQKYNETIMDIFMVSKTSHSWKVPDLEFTNSADESIYACGYLFDQYQCRWVSRYKRYLVELGMDITSNGYSLEDFKNAILIIDNKLSNCLKYDQ